MNTALARRDLLSSLKADPEYRHAWNLENVYTGVCFQIRALREQRGWSQATLGKAARMAQERVSILEDPNADTKPTLNTLLRIADACDVGLDVRFVSYGTVLDRSTKTDLKTLEVPSFDADLPRLEREIERNERPASLYLVGAGAEMEAQPDPTQLPSQKTIMDFAFFSKKPAGAEQTAIARPA